MATHYDVLGLSHDVGPDDIKSAYRRLAREFHPDLNPDPAAKEKFLAVQKAYEVLSDDPRRAAYDQIIGATKATAQPSPPKENLSAAERKREKEAREAEELRKKAEEMMREHARATKVDHQASEELMSLLNANKFAQAERLALQMLAEESRQPVPYAVLGDIARYRGEIGKAIQFYGYAAQYEPTNPIYQRTYEQLLNRQPTTKVAVESPVAQDSSLTALPVGGFAVVSMAIYVALAPERPMLLPLAPALTLGSLVMLLIAGVVCGTCLSLSRSIDSFESTSGSAVTRVPPALSLGLLSILSFWLASLVYFAVGHTQQVFNRSLSLLLGTVGGVTLLFSLAGLAKGPQLATSILALGGNVLCLGAVLGWYVADRLRT